MPVSTLVAGSLPHPESKKASGPDGRGREGSENRNVGLGSGRKREALSTGVGGAGGGTGSTAASHHSAQASRRPSRI